MWEEGPQEGWQWSGYKVNKKNVTASVFLLSVVIHTYGYLSASYNGKNYKYFKH